MISPRIKAITFDAVGTLIVPYPSVGEIYSTEMANFGVHLKPKLIEQRFRVAFATTSKDRTIENSEKREYEFWKSIVRQTILSAEESPGFGFSRFFDRLWALFASAKPWKLTAPAAETLETLSSNYCLALLTNWDSRARSVFEELGLAHFFDDIIISSEVGYDKPDRRIFEAAAKRLNVTPSEILHIGDSLNEDIAGAINAGCEAAWLSSDNAQALPSRAIQICSIKEIL